MDIKQVEQDFKDGIMLSKVTVAKLIAAAVLMENSLEFIGRDGQPEHVKVAVQSALLEVGAL